MNEVVNNHRADIWYNLPYCARPFLQLALDFSFYTGGCVCWMILYTPSHMIILLILLTEMAKSD